MLRPNLILPAGLLLAGLTAPSARDHSTSIIISLDDWPLTSCAQIRVSFDGASAERTQRAESELTIPLAELDRFEATAPEHGGVHVVAWDRPEWSVKLCKAVGGRDAERAASQLARIELVREGRMRVTGPDEDVPWAAYLIVRAPRAAAVDLRASAGSTAVHGLSGRVQLHSENGPISLDACDGEIDAATVNGPLQFSGGAGRVALRTANGPIQVELEGVAWKTGALEVRTQNGPLSLKLSAAYRSGVRLDSSQHAPFACGQSCDQVRTSWSENGRRLELGAGTPAVRLSTVNGPVSIETRASRLL
ncbi:MAG TPA: hypothetical protein VJS92_17945 [Candidatus Polarisedimenticolaceae bacterium]|nr:hypothetical protein [Candidatus Polarisedimenticolaceae bacterium]